uniref:Uncharacterized protein n=1 Tax=Peronospora matthiolae TaxID=2874970 RepID=A0AAV1UFB5_9STRA
MVAVGRLNAAERGLELSSGGGEGGGDSPLLQVAE